MRETIENKIRMKINTKSNAELMLVYSQGSPDEAMIAFGEIYERYAQKVFHYLERRTKNKIESEDLLQKVFIKFHECKHLYKSEYSLEQWLFVIARSISLDFFRSHKRYRDRIEKFSKESEFSLNEEDKNEWDLSFMNRLEDKDKELLELKYLDDLSYKEISNILNKTEGSLRKSVSRLINRLKTGEAV